jgi:cyclo(L-tyrosyl-L-tyrosyl) synthase
MIQKLYSKGLQIEQIKHAMIGVSPFNGYFKEEILIKLIAWASQNFERFNLFIPDAPVVYTLKALGYSESDAQRKMLKQSRWMKNKMIRALHSAGYPDAEKYIFDWQRLSLNSWFVRQYDGIKMRFKVDESFKRLCMDTSLECYKHAVSINNGKLGELGNLELAAQYLLCEIPFMTATPSILGVESSVFCYHHDFKLLEKLYEESDSWINPTQAYAVLEDLSTV